MVDHDELLDMLTRLKLTAIRDQLDSLLDEAARRELTLREAVAFLCEREIARKDERRVEMASKIAHFRNPPPEAAFPGLSRCPRLGRCLTAAVVGSVRECSYGHKFAGGASEPVVAGGAEAGDRGGVAGAWVIGVARGAALRREREPGVRLAEALCR
ncbi:hypothetical protein [Inquilinus limosus]|uniref:hypothetical protein n=1 Tax=Inquilinus limosus TaxID=171674 RepID=UPI003F5CCA61